MQDSIHLPVMTTEVLKYLEASQGGCYLDCTFGGGGHSKAVLDAHQDNIVHGCDRDLQAAERAEELEKKNERFFAHHTSFKDIALLFQNQKFDGVLADLGLSSDQLASDRGFSFKDDRSLDMRMDERDPITAHEIINHFDKQQLIALLRRGGVDKQAGSIAQAIIDHRPVENAKDLADVINKSIRMNPNKKINPATIAFQAIRIEVNDELSQIKSLLDAIPQIVKSGSRLVIISFHSLEDKLVTRTLRDWSTGDTTPALWAKVDQEQEVLGELITKKAIVSGSDEINSNPRARSAKLRAFKFKGG